MKVHDLFSFALKQGIAADPRGKAGVDLWLKRAKKEFDDLKPAEKKFFDTDRLTNPYPDSCIHVDDEKTEVKRILAGIDISSSEILLASQLNERGKKVDLLVSHHPKGKALANLHEVMEMSVQVYEDLGVPVHIAEKIFEERVKEVGRRIHPINHFAEIDMAGLLQVNFMNTHTISDNLVNEYMIDYLKKKKPETIGDVMEALLELPEYQEAEKVGAGPKIISGAPKHRVGKILVEMTGGTTPSNKVYEQLSQYGVSTIVGMHMRDEAMEKTTELNMNVIIAGHMSSDSLGMNLLLDEFEKRGIEVVSCGGLIRVNRNKKKK